MFATTTSGLPSAFSYRNLGTVKDKGLELGIDGAVNQALNLFANYSFQAEPEPDFDKSEINLPPISIRMARELVEKALSGEGGGVRDVEPRVEGTQPAAQDAVKLQASHALWSVARRPDVGIAE